MMVRFALIMLMKMTLVMMIAMLAADDGSATDYDDEYVHAADCVHGVCDNDCCVC